MSLCQVDSSENIYARGLLCMSCFSYLCVCFQIDSDRMNQLKGIIYAAVSSATFGLAPFFSISLLAVGFSSFEVLTYRWGVARWYCYCSDSLQDVISGWGLRSL